MRWRLLRGGLFAMVSSQLAALGHLVGGGMLPSPAIVLGVGGLIAMEAVGLASRQRGFLGILSLLASSQLLFHLLFSTTTMCGRPAATGLAEPGGMPGMEGPAGMSGMAGTIGMSGMAGTAGMSETCAGLDVVRMVTFHAIAAALSALLLAHGDAVLFRLAAIWLRVLRRPVARLHCAPNTIGWSVRTSTRWALPAGPALMRHPRRGPPPS